MSTTGPKTEKQGLMGITVACELKFVSGTAKHGGVHCFAGLVAPRMSCHVQLATECVFVCFSKCFVAADVQSLNVMQHDSVS